MIVIRCPHCQVERHEDELFYGGEALPPRPSDPLQLSDPEWTGRLFFRSNPEGAVIEDWCCAAGCGHWFRVRRCTASHAILDVAPPPAMPVPLPEFSS